jgi:hypothetical protein
MPRMLRLSWRCCCTNGFGGKATHRKLRPDTPQLSTPCRAKTKPQRVNPQPSTAAAVQEGLLREFARQGDAFHDMVMMALLRKDWSPAQKVDRPTVSIAPQKALA